jgi:hypothetical protein
MEVRQENNRNLRHQSIQPKAQHPAEIGPYTLDLEQMVCKKKQEDMPRGLWHGPEARKDQINADMIDFRKLQHQDMKQNRTAIGEVSRGDIRCALLPSPSRSLIWCNLQ